MKTRNQGNTLRRRRSGRIGSVRGVWFQKMRTRSAASVHWLSSCMEPERIPGMVTSGRKPRALAHVLQVATSPSRASEFIMRSTL